MKLQCPAGRDIRLDDVSPLARGAPVNGVVVHLLFSFPRRVVHLIHEHFRRLPTLTGENFVSPIFTPFVNLLA